MVRNGRPHFVWPVGLRSIGADLTGEAAVGIRSAIIVAVAMLVAVGGWQLHKRFSVLARAEADLGSPAIDVRVRAARRLRYQHDQRSLALLAGVLADPAAQVRRVASRSLYRLGAPEAAPPLLGAIGVEKDPRTRYEMMVCWAELVRPEGQQRLDHWRRSADPWARLAWAKASLLRGRVAGAAGLFELAGGEQDRVRAAAGRALRELCVPMMEMVGSRVSMSGGLEDPIGPGELQRLEQWWADRVSPKVLQATVRWQRDPPRELRMVGKLVRAQGRASRWLGLTAKH